MTTILTTAMEKEYDVINKSVKKCNLMERWGTSLYVQRTGIGKVNAASHLTELLEDNMNETFDRVISIGCAGAASPYPKSWRYRDRKLLLLPRCVLRRTKLQWASPGIASRFSFLLRVDKELGEIHSWDDSFRRLVREHT